MEVFGSKFDRQVGGVEPEEGARGVSVFYVFGAGDITITAALDDDLDTTLPTSTTITIHRRAIGTYRISAGIRLPQLFAPRYVTNDVSRTITRFVDVELLRPVRGAAVVPLAQLTIYAGRYGFAALDPDNSTVYASSGLAGDVPYLRPVANIYDGEEWRFIYRLFSTSSVSGFRTITIGIEPTNADIAYQPHYIDITTELGTSFFLDMRTAPLDYDLRNTPTLFAGRAPVGSGYNTIPLTIAGGVGQGSYGLSVAAADGISASVRFVSFFTGGHIANGELLIGDAIDEGDYWITVYASDPAGTTITNAFMARAFGSLSVRYLRQLPFLSARVADTVEYQLDNHLGRGDLWVSVISPFGFAISLDAATANLGLTGAFAIESRRAGDYYIDIVAGYNSAPERDYILPSTSRLSLKSRDRRLYVEPILAPITTTLRTAVRAVLTLSVLGGFEPYRYVIESLQGSRLTEAERDYVKIGVPLAANEVYVDLPDTFEEGVLSRRVLIYDSRTDGGANVQGAANFNIRVIPRTQVFEMSVVPPISATSYVSLAVSHSPQVFSQGGAGVYRYTASPPDAVTIDSTRLFVQFLRAGTITATIMADDSYQGTPPVLLTNTVRVFGGRFGVSVGAQLATLSSPPAKTAQTNAYYQSLPHPAEMRYNDKRPRRLVRIPAANECDTAKLT